MALGVSRYCCFHSPKPGYRDVKILELQSFDHLSIRGDDKKVGEITRTREQVCLYHSDLAVIMLLLRVEVYTEWRSREVCSHLLCNPVLMVSSASNAEQCVSRKGASAMAVQDVVEKTS